MDRTAHTTVAQANDDQDLPASIHSDEAPAAIPAPLLRFSDLRVSRCALARARATADSESSANATGIIVAPATLTGTRIVYSVGLATQTPSSPPMRYGVRGPRAIRMPLDLIPMRGLPLVNDRDPPDSGDRDEEDVEEDDEDNSEVDTHPSSAPGEEIPGIASPPSGIPLHPSRLGEQLGVIVSFVSCITDPLLTLWCRPFQNQSAWKPPIPQVAGMHERLAAEEQAKEAGGVPRVRHGVDMPECAYFLSVMFVLSSSSL